MYHTNSLLSAFSSEIAATWSSSLALCSHPSKPSLVSLLSSCIFFPPKRALGFSRELRWLFCSFSTKHASRADKVAKMKPFLLVLVVTMVQALDHCSHKLDNHYWSTELKSCLPCTNCHDQRLITIIGCAPDKDTICGTIEDLR